MDRATANQKAASNSIDTAATSPSNGLAGVSIFVRGIGYLLFAGFLGLLGLGTLAVVCIVGFLFLESVLKVCCRTVTNRQDPALVAQEAAEHAAFRVRYDASIRTREVQAAAKQAQLKHAEARAAAATTPGQLCLIALPVSLPIIYGLVKLFS